MLGQQLPDQGEACLILGRFGLGVLFDFHGFQVVAPGNQHVWRVSMLLALMLVFEVERLFLPGIGARGRDQDLERFELVLRLGVPRSAARNVRYFALYSRLRPAYRLTHPRGWSSFASCEAAKVSLLWSGPSTNPASAVRDQAKALAILSSSCILSKEVIFLYKEILTRINKLVNIKRMVISL